MESTNFHKLADAILESIFDDIENSGNDDADVDNLNGILSIGLPNGQYIINKHEPTRQIWLSSPISGAHKFSFIDSNQNWQKLEGKELKQFLYSELNFM